MRRRLITLIIGSTLTLPAAIGTFQPAFASDSKPNQEVPTFRLDSDWPKPLPNFWITGNIGAMHMDKDDQLWIVQRPNSTIGLGERDGMLGQGECCFPGPPIMVFDSAGKLVKSWGPVHVTDTATKKEILLDKQVSPAYPEGVWPTSEHSLFIDHKDNVWLAGNNEGSQLIKLTREGKYLARIGRQEAKSSNDKVNMAGPAGIYVDPKTNEIFVADGYRNRRVVVFDADTGAYKRHWGAYGKIPPDGPQQAGMIIPDLDKQREQFAVVHCLVATRDELLYVCDRANGRVQVFRKDGTFVNEVYVQPTEKGIGSVYALAFSPDERFMYVGDGSNKKVHILRRSDLKIVGSFGTGGRGAGQFLEIHALAVDSKGNVYVGETVDNNRVQRFIFTGIQSASAAK